MKQKFVLISKKNIITMLLFTVFSYVERTDDENFILCKERTYGD